MNDSAGATTYCTEALAIAEATGAGQLTASVSPSLAESEFHSGDAHRALQLGTKALDALRAGPIGYNLACGLNNLAAYLSALGRYEAARPRALEALAMARDVRAEVQTAFALQHLAAIAALQPIEDADRAHANRSRAAQCLATSILGWASLERCASTPKGKNPTTCLPRCATPTVKPNCQTFSAKAVTGLKISPSQRHEANKVEGKAPPKILRRRTVRSKAESNSDIDAVDDNLCENMSICCPMGVFARWSTRIKKSRVVRLSEGLERRSTAAGWRSDSPCLRSLHG